MIRNSRNIWPIETSAIAGAKPAALWGSALAAASLMTLGLVPLEPVNHSRLGHAEREPGLHVILQRDVKLGRQLPLLFGDVLSAIELYLKGELPHQRLMFAPRAPQPDVALGNYSFPKIQLTKRKQYLLHNAFIDQTDLLGI